MTAAPARRVRVETCGPDALLLLADYGARQRAMRLSYPEAAELAAELAERAAEHQAEAEVRQ